MNILVAAYEFPPARSPQAMRWASLSAELVRLGHSVTVLTTITRGGVGGGDGLPSASDEGGLRIVRTEPFRALRVLGLLRRLAGRSPASGAPVEIPRRFEGLNWRGRIIATLGRLLEWRAFPDLRARWNETAGPALARLIREQRPDVVVTSHEPASVLLLGRVAVRAGVPWVADLGDPVDADYLPRRWRARARRLERQVCDEAALVTVTTRAYGATLEARHGLEAHRLRLLRQGFRRDADATRETEGFDPRVLELVYTGQLYGFRPTGALFDALASLDGIRLTLISPQSPGLRSLADTLGGRLRLMAPVAQPEAVRWQRGADILLNVGNTMPAQVPGKLFEYFGSQRPVLHLSACDPDESASLVAERRRGWVVPNDPARIRETLLELQARWRDGRLHDGIDLSMDAVDDLSWQALGEGLARSLEQAIEHGTRQTHA
ncbi:hypothetical protein GCM10028862_18420 [Luteimonas pelagia]